MAKPSTVKEHLIESVIQKETKKIKAGTLSPSDDCLSFIKNYSKAVSASSSKYLGNVITVLN